MDKGIKYLNEAKQNYIQFDVKEAVCVSPAIFEYAEDELPENESMVIYEGWAPTIEISSLSEYKEYKRVNNGHDYNINEKGIIFSTNDIEIIKKVVLSTYMYFEHKDYEQYIDDLINSIKKERTLKLTK